MVNINRICQLMINKICMTNKIHSITISWVTTKLKYQKFLAIKRNVQMSRVQEDTLLLMCTCSINLQILLKSQLIINLEEHKINTNKMVISSKKMLTWEIQSLNIKTMKRWMNHCSTIQVEALDPMLLVNQSQIKLATWEIIG